jgi:hypothetical protein
VDVVVPSRDPSKEEPIFKVSLTRVLWMYLDTKRYGLDNVRCCCAPDVVSPDGLVGVLPELSWSNLPYLRGLLDCIMQRLRHLNPQLCTKAEVKVSNELVDLQLLHVHKRGISKYPINLVS